MSDANCDGVARRSDSVELKVGKGRNLPISELIGSSPKFMAVFEDVRTIRGWPQAGMVPQSVHKNEEEPQ